MENIATAADTVAVVDRRTHAGDDNLLSLSVVLPVLAVAPRMHESGVVVQFLNPVTPWIFESDDFLQDVGAQKEPGLVLATTVASPVAGVPCDRHEYLAQTPTTHSRAQSSPHAPFWGLGERREVVSQVKNKTFGPLLDFPPDGLDLFPSMLCIETSSLVRARLPRKSCRRTRGRYDWSSLDS